MLAFAAVAHDPIFGDPTLWNASSPLRVKGTLLSARPRYVRERWGEAMIDDVAARVGDEARHVLREDILPFRWYPMAVLADIDRAIVQGPMEGDITLMKAFGSEIARYDLPTVYKMLFRFGTPAFVIKRIKVAYASYIQGGRIQSEVPEPHRARVSLHEAALPRYLCTHGISGWLTAALELSGAKAVHAEETACTHDGAPHCQWDARWS
jgi:predicted hydrocarbon binding protein